MIPDKNSYLKSIIILVAAACMTALSATAQRGNSPSSTAKKVVYPPAVAWTMLPPLGLHEEAEVDTLPDNYGQRFIPSFGSAAYATTGNLGSEGLNMIWSEREGRSDFFFRDALRRWIPSEEKMKFYNTHIPMTLLSYSTAGGRDDAQERLGVTFSGNANKRTQVGALLDYLYSKGCYANQAGKNLTWGFSGSYMGDRYEFQGYYYHYNSLNKENGGITDPLYITDPALIQGGVTSVNTLTIPTNLTDAHTRVKGGQLLLNNRYKVGYWQEEKDENDSVISREYIPVTSFIYTLKYTEAKHNFRLTSQRCMEEFFDNTYLDPTLTSDWTKYHSLQNTLGISLLEGFNKYSKFGLSAYATYEINKYTQTPDTLDRTAVEGLTPFPEGITAIAPSASENKAWVGAQLTKQRGSILRYSATGEIGVVGRAAGDLRINGVIDTRIPLRFDSVEVKAFGRFSNEAAPYLMRNYLSNHFIWQNDFGKVRSLRLGGEITSAFTGTRISAQVENIQHYIYFGPDFLPVQHSGSVQLFTARLQQKIALGAFHWDNDIIYQTTSDDNVIALPNLAIYSNMYIKVKIATLFLQLGADCDYYTRYYAPKYQPATASFANQRDIKLGNYPFINVYANMKLSKVRFYVMFSHLNQGWFSRDYFSMPDYPLNPRRLQIGLSVDFAD